MKVSEVMSATPFYCGPHTNLGSAAELLWNQDCGILPIVDDDQKVIGVVTDRDLFIALGTRNRLPGEITVGEVCSSTVHLCYADDDIHTALGTMARRKVRRLPVVDRKGTLQGILSMDDVVVHSEPRRPGGPSELPFEEVMGTLKKIYAPQAPLAAQGRAVSA
jgi:CBS domain-containing protein